MLCNQVILVWVCWSCQSLSQLPSLESWFQHVFHWDLDLWHSELPSQRSEIPAGLAHCFYCLFRFETFQWNFQRYIAKVTFQIKMHQLGQESSRVFWGDRERKYPHGEWREPKAGSALSFVEVFLWSFMDGGFGPLFKNLLSDSDREKLSLSGILPWVCWEPKCPAEQHSSTLCGCSVPKGHRKRLLHSSLTANTWKMW